MFYSAHILDRNTLFHTNISPKAANARKLIDFLSSETFHFIIYDCISNTCYTMKNINRIRSFNIRQRNMEFVSNLIWNLTRMFKCISKKQTNLERIRKISYTINIFFVLSFVLFSRKNKLVAFVCSSLNDFMSCLWVGCTRRPKKKYRRI